MYRREYRERFTRESKDKHGFHAIRFELMVHQVLRNTVPTTGGTLPMIHLLDLDGSGGPDFGVYPIEGGPPFYVEASQSFFPEDPQLKEIEKWFTEDLKADSYWLTIGVDGIRPGYLKTANIRSRLVTGIKDAVEDGLRLVEGKQFEFLLEVDGVRFRVYVTRSPNAWGFSGGLVYGGAFDSIRQLKNKLKDKNKQRKKWLKRINREDWEPLYFLALAPDFTLVDTLHYDSDMRRILGSYPKISGVLTFSYAAMGNLSGDIKLIPNKGVDVPDQLKPFLEGVPAHYRSTPICDLGI